jgi:hypothetical protein
MIITRRYNIPDEVCDRLVSRDGVIAGSLPGLLADLIDELVTEYKGMEIALSKGGDLGMYEKEDLDEPENIRVANV